MKEEQLELDGLALQLLYDLSMGLPSASALGLKRWSSATTSSRDMEDGGRQAPEDVHALYLKEVTLCYGSTCGRQRVTRSWSKKLVMLGLLLAAAAERNGQIWTDSTLPSDDAAVS